MGKNIIIAVLVLFLSSPLYADLSYVESNFGVGGNVTGNTVSGSTVSGNTAYFGNYPNYCASFDSWGTLKTSGRKEAKVTVTTTYSALPTDEVIVCNSTTAFTVTLPVASGSGRILKIKNINTASVTVDGANSDTIDGDPTVIISQWDCVQIVDYANTKWAIM